MAISNRLPTPPEDDRELSKAEHDELWASLAPLLTRFGVRANLVVMAQLVQFHCIQLYELNEVPALYVDLMDLGSKHARGTEREPT